MITTLLSPEHSKARRGLSQFVTSLKPKKPLPTHPGDADIRQPRFAEQPSDDLPPPPPPKDTELGYLPRTPTKPRSYTVSGHESGSSHAPYGYDQPGPVQASISTHSYTSSQESTLGTFGHHNHSHIRLENTTHSRIPRYTHSRNQTLPSADMMKHSLSHTAVITPMDDSFNLSESYHLVPRPTQDTVVLRPQLPPMPRNPQERAKLRLEVQRAREKEDAEIAREEAERQARIKVEKEELLRKEEEEAEQRKAHLNREIQLALARRQRMEYFQKAEEEKERKMLEERQVLERQKRLEEGKKHEEWRQQQAQKTEEARKAAERAQREEVEERRSKLKEAKENLKRTADPVTTGWVTIQLGQTLIWRRRFFKLIGTGLMLYKSADPADIHHGALDTIEMGGRVSRFCEWSDGYEELRAIPHSFAVEFKDDTVWSMFTDTESDKFMLLALLQQAASAL